MRLCVPHFRKALSSDGTLVAMRPNGTLDMGYIHTHTHTYTR